MEITPVKPEDREKYMELLLVADEQESMVRRYLSRGSVFALYDGDLKAVCVVTDEGEGRLELKNLAVVPEYQRQGYGMRLVSWLFEYYNGKGNAMYVGTGDVPSARNFYQRCGFEYSHSVKHFFTQNYDHPMIEEGIKLDDMVYYKHTLNKK